MKLTRVQVQDFKAVEKINIELADASLLVGENNSGKSSVLQAIHFASRLMNVAPEANKQSTVSLREIEYIPTEAYKKIGYNKDWGNQATQPESAIEFEFTLDGGDKKTASVVLKSARNEGVSVNPQMPPELQAVFRGKTAVVSAYIPGVAGIPLKEEKITKRLVYTKAASGDSNIILRNILLLLKEEGRINNAIDSIRELYNDNSINIDVNFDEERDLYITANFSKSGMEGVRPLELAGTGLIQSLQIFSYLYLFKPKIILLDEPEAHLHPPLQTRLVKILQKRVADEGTVVLISTHSPFVAAGLSGNAQTIWLKNGEVAASSDNQMLREAVGWGALDKKCIICAEDKDLNPLKSIIEQDNQLYREIACVPFSGLSKIPTPEALKAFREALGGKHKVAVYRDRDGLTDDEISRWSKPFNDHKIFTLVSPGSDVESCFCVAEVVAEARECSVSDAEKLIEKIIDENIDDFRKKFINKRRDINKKMNADGGAISTEELLDKERADRWILGKDILSRINEKNQEDGYKALTKTAGAYKFTLGSEMLKDIRVILD